MKLSIVQLVVFLWACAPTGAILLGQEDPAPPPSAESPSPAEAPSVPSELDATARPFNEACWDSFRTRQDQLSVASTRQWLEKVDGHEFELAETQNQFGQAITFKGLARLRPPWAADAALRFSFSSPQWFALHFWTGEHGVSLRYTSANNRQTWSAYRITRRPGDALSFGGPALRVNDPGFALLTTDDQRAGHSACGTYVVRHQNGALLLTKGDMLLVKMPLEVPPTEVYMESDSALLRHLALFQQGVVPDPEMPDREVVVYGRLPASLSWHESLPTGAELQRRRDGSLRFAAHTTEAPATLAMPLVRQGLYEVTFEIENITPGVGLFLGNGDGQSLYGVRYYRDPRSGLTAFRLGEAHDTSAPPAMNLNTAPVTFAPRRQWLRLVSVCGLLRCWTSVDGRNWGQPFVPMAGSSPNYSHVVIALAPGPGHREVVLRRLQVRQLDAITSLVPAALLQQVLSLRLGERLDQGGGIGAWQQLVYENQPAEIDTAVWRRACCVARLIEGVEPAFANALCDILLDEFLAGPAPLDQKLRLLADVTLIYDKRLPADVGRLAAYYDRLAASSVREASEEDFDRIRQAKMQIPLWTQAHDLQPVSEPLVRAALLKYTFAGDAQPALHLCRQLSFWNHLPGLDPNWPGPQAQLRPLVDWVQAQFDDGPADDAEEPVGTQMLQWRHPLRVQLGKDAANVQAELQAGLDNKFYEHAARIVTSQLTAEAAGMVTDHADTQLTVSLPLAIEQSIRQDEPFRDILNKQFGGIARLRIQSAILDRDESAIRQATVCFAGTNTASIAHRWLADRYLSLGRFSRALRHYELALKSTDPDNQNQLLALERLAAAMLGRRIDGTTKDRVTYGEYTLQPTEFDELVEEMLQQHERPEADSQTATSPPPQPAYLKASPWGMFDGEMGANPTQVPAPSQEVDWPARQLSVATTSKLMIVHNRFQVTAFNIENGSRAWIYSLGDEQGPTHAWPLIPMRPLIVGDRCFLRVLPKSGQPELICLDISTGQRLWTASLARPVASDPVMIDNQLFVLVVSYDNSRQVRYWNLVEVDPDSGTPLRETLLEDFQHQQSTDTVCQVATAKSQLIMVIAGGVVCCDTSGDVQWIRRATWLPPALDVAADKHLYQSPLVLNGRLYVTVPGFQGVECLDPQSGQLWWRSPLPGIQRMLGATADNLLIETNDGIVAASLESGGIAWRHDTRDVLDILAPHKTAEQLLYLQLDQVSNNEFVPVLVWLDVHTGQSIARCPLLELSGVRPAIGPLLSTADRTWCLVGIADEKGALTPTRQIMELVAGNGSVNLTDGPLTDAWQPSISQPFDRALFNRALSAAFPGWVLLDGTSDAQTGLHREKGGRDNVLVTRAAPAAPTRLARYATLVDSQHPRLLLEVRAESDQPSQILIAAGGLPVLQHTLKPSPAAPTWESLSVDLSDFAGRNVWLTITHNPTGNAPAYTCWSKFDLDPK